jgi:hypothetical protein
VGIGEGDGQHEAGEAGAGADVGDAVGGAQVVDLETGEAVRQVRQRRLLAGPSGRGRVGLGLEGGQEELELIGGSAAEPVPGGQLRGRFTRNGQAPLTPRTGVSTRRRSGSSPSLCVSMSVRPRR